MSDFERLLKLTLDGDVGAAAALDVEAKRRGDDWARLVSLLARPDVMSWFPLRRLLEGWEEADRGNAVLYAQAALRRWPREIPLLPGSERQFRRWGEQPRPNLLDVISYPSYYQLDVWEDLDGDLRAEAWILGTLKEVWEALHDWLIENVEEALSTTVFQATVTAFEGGRAVAGAHIMPHVSVEGAVVFDDAGHLVPLERCSLRSLEDLGVVHEAINPADVTFHIDTAAVPIPPIRPPVLAKGQAVTAPWEPEEQWARYGHSNNWDGLLPAWVNGGGFAV